MTKYEEFIKNTNKTEVSYQRICWAITYVAIVAIVGVTLIGHAFTAGLEIGVESMSPVEDTSVSVVEAEEEEYMTAAEQASYYSHNNFGVVGEESYAHTQEEEYHWDPAWLEHLHVEEQAKQDAAREAAEAERREQKLIEDCLLSAELQWIAYDAIQESGIIKPSTFFALMEHESGFQTNAISPTDDYGLCQVNACTIPYLSRELGITSVYELLDGETCIRASIALLEYNADYASSEAAILSMYHMGVGGYSNWLQTSGGYATTPALEILEMSAKYKELDLSPALFCFTYT